MSGSDSSVPRSAADRAPEPLSFTVHSPPDGSAGMAARRGGRVRMLLVMLVCAAPVIASYLSYFVIKPEGRSNYGSLIAPTRSMPALDLTHALATVDGKTLASASLKGQWLLLVVAPSSCDAACEKRLYMQRQLREMLGREKDRLDKIWLVTDAGAIASPLAAAMSSAPATQVLRADRAALAAWLQPEPGHALEDHLYLVDPMGEWMMRMPAQADPVRVKRDLERLLRASASWDRPGR